MAVLHINLAGLHLKYQTKTSFKTKTVKSIWADYGYALIY